MFRLPAGMFTALFFVIPAAALAQIALVWFTPNVQDGQTFTAIRSIAHPFGQVASPFPGETSSGLGFASLLFQPQFRSVRMWACSKVRVMPSLVLLTKTSVLSVSFAIFGPFPWDFLTN